MGTQGMPVYAMPRMLEFLSGNGPWSQLVSLGNIDLQRLEHDTPIRMGKQFIHFSSLIGTNIPKLYGYRIEGPNRTALFIPDINKWEDWEVSIVEALEAVNYALIDASFFADGELGNRDMSQIPHPFVSETMALFEQSSAEVRNKIWFIHMNQSNTSSQPEQRRHSPGAGSGVQRRPRRRQATALDVFT